MIFDSIKKHFKIKKISKRLGASEAVDVKNLVNHFSEQDEALDDLYNLSIGFKNTNKLLVEHQVDEEMFKSIYNNLCISGAGHWVNGHWVAASSLVSGTTLEYLLEEIDKHKKERLRRLSAFSKPQGFWLNIVHNLVEYFKKGKIEKVD